MIKDEGLHKHAFWLYGVIVGLAIKTSLESVTPHLISPPSALPFGFFPDLARLAIFLILIIRFYFGSAIFFDVAYEHPTADTQYKKKNYALDFLFGFFHFLAFFLLAFSIDVHSQPIMLFPMLLGIILFFDVPWFAFCRKYDTRYMMVWWMVLNTVTLLVAALIYLLTYLLTANKILSEQLAFIVIVIASAVDFAEIVTRRPLIADWLAHLLYRDRHTGTPSTDDSTTPTEPPPTPPVL